MISSAWTARSANASSWPSSAWWPPKTVGDVRALTGVPGEFRLRVGDWRVRYELDTEAEQLLVLRVHDQHITGLLLREALHLLTQLLARRHTPKATPAAKPRQSRAATVSRRRPSARTQTGRV